MEYLFPVLDCVKKIMGTLLLELTNFYNLINFLFSQYLLPHQAGLGANSAVVAAVKFNDQ